MSRHFSLLISWGSIAVIGVVMIAAIFFLLDINSFAELARNNIGLPIAWATVEQWQWYGLWFVTLLYMGIGLVGLFFLQRAFAKFASGEFFNLDNSSNLRRFSILLLVQALAKPLHLALSSVLLSSNHPAGQKMLSVSFGSHEIRMLALALIIWVVCDLLVEGAKLKSENQQFV